MITETEILTRINRLTQERLTVCIARAWVRPQRSAIEHVFDEADVARLRLIVDLTEDMAVNDDSVPLILNLIDEVSGLRRRMHVVNAALAETPQLRDTVIAQIERIMRDDR